jgi:hypothetical protein
LRWMNVGHTLTKPSLPRASSCSWVAYDGPVQCPLANQPPPHTTDDCKLVHPEGVDAMWLNGPEAGRETLPQHCWAART